MTRIIFALVLLHFQLVLFGQDSSDIVKAEHLNPSQLIGTCGQDRVYYTFKKNKTCKMTLVAPRNLVYKGTWELHNDTLICTFDHVNTIGQGDNKTLENGPRVDKFIVYRKSLYYLEPKDGKLTPVFVSKLP